MFAQVAMPDSVCMGDQGNYFVDSNLVAGSSYTWEIDGVIQNTTGNNIFITWHYSGTFLLEVQELSLAGCSGSIISGQIIVSSRPSINIQPSDQTACPGISASFAVSATGSGITYQWRKGTSNLLDSGNISGVKTPTLTIFPVSLADAATDYNVRVSGTCLPELTSTYVALKINSLGVDLSDFVNSEDVISIYPNPFNTLINVVIKEDAQIDRCDFMIFNVLGERVYYASITKHITTLEMGKLPAGVYFYRAIDKEYSVQSGKLISQ